MISSTSFSNCTDLTMRIDGGLVRKGFYKIYSVDFEDEKSNKIGTSSPILENDLTKITSLLMKIDRFMRIRMIIKGDLRVPNLLEHELTLVVSKGDTIV